MSLHLFRINQPVLPAWSIRPLAADGSEPSYRTGALVQFPLGVRFIYKRG